MSRSYVKTIFVTFIITYPEELLYILLLNIKNAITTWSLLVSPTIRGYTFPYTFPDPANDMTNIGRVFISGD